MQNLTELLPPRPQQRQISLTPLVDVIFLLLIFFMLTSQIAPFSLISLSGTKAEIPVADALPRLSNPTNVKAPLSVLVTVLNGSIAINGRPVPASEIETSLVELRRSGVERAIISPRSTATVQDLISILEAVKKMGFKSITIRKSG